MAMEDYSKPAAIDFQWMSRERWIDSARNTISLDAVFQGRCQAGHVMISAWRRGVEHDNVHLLTGFRCGQVG